MHSSGFHFQRAITFLAALFTIVLLAIGLVTGVLQEAIRSIPDTLQVESWLEFVVSESEAGLLRWAYYYLLVVLFIQLAIGLLILVRSQYNYTLLYFAEFLVAFSIAAACFGLLYGLGIAVSEAEQILALTLSSVGIGLGLYAIIRAFEEYPQGNEYLVGFLPYGKAYVGYLAAKKQKSERKPETGASKVTRWHRMRRNYRAGLLRLDRKLFRLFKGATTSRFVELQVSSNRRVQIGLPIAVTSCLLSALAIIRLTPEYDEAALPLLFLSFVGVMFGMSAGFTKMGMLQRFGDGQIRDQAAWIFLGTQATVIVFTALYIGSQLLGFLFYPMLVGIGILVLSTFYPATGYLAFSMMLSFSIFLRGEIDPRLALSKSSIYTLLAISLTVLFVILEAIITSNAVVRLGVPSDSGSLIAGVGTALMFAPMRNLIERRIQLLVDKSMPVDALADGARYEAVIVFSNMSNFTALADEDETIALSIAAWFHRESDRLAKERRGRLVKTIGDAVLMEFPNSDSALFTLERLTQSLSSECTRRNLAAIHLHSGMHRGPIVHGKNHDIFGRTVNIASRLQNLADPDQVILSVDAQDSLKIKQSNAQYMGALELKNVKCLLHCYRITLAGLSVPSSSV